MQKPFEGCKSPLRGAGALSGVQKPFEGCRSPFRAAGTMQRQLCGRLLIVCQETACAQTKLMLHARVWHVTDPDGVWDDMR